MRPELIDGSEAGYEVVTWLDERKAESPAVERHIHLRGEVPAVRTAHVEDVGPAPSDDEGRVAIPRGAAFDRMEF